MSKQATAIIAVVSFVSGALVATWCAVAFYTQLTSQLVVGSSTSDAVMTVFELRSLRANNATNAVESLEIKLDVDLIGLTTYLGKPYGFNRDPSYAKALQMVRDYRIEYPHKSVVPEVDAGVTNALKLLDGQTNH